MTDMHSEKELRERVRQLRDFYKHLAIYAVINVFCIFLWAVSGGGYFWPIWVMIGWGIGLGLQAVSLGMVPMLKETLPFLSDEWEEQQVKKLMKQEKPSKPAVSPPKKPTKK